MNNRHPHLLPRHNRLAAAVLVALLPVGALAAPSLEFNTAFLHGADSGQIDISRFETDGLLPGTYSADIIVNDVSVGRREIEARTMESGEVRVCLDPALFDMLPLNMGKLEAARQQHEGEPLLAFPQAPTCEALSRFIPSALATLDAGEQRLEISIPHAYVDSRREGWVDPSRWDPGINALLLNYHVNHTEMEQGGRRVNHTGASLDAGLNLGAWRFRHSGYFSQNSNGDRSYVASRSYAEREVRRWNAQLTLGESSTAGDLFSSVNYLGANLRTDTRMLPEIYGNYAPIVSGVAQTNARVTISQRGRVIREITVAPGPFEIDDLSNTSGGGDLEVEVTEADGRVERFVVPYASVPQLLRQGQQRSSLTVGTLQGTSHDEPAFVEATVRRGVGSGFTGYGGALVSEGYHSLVLGGALNTRIGAFAGDVTFSDTRFSDPVEGFGKSMWGQSYRLAYSRSFNAATSFTLSAYRYSTDGFLSFNDAARLREDIANGNGARSVMRQRSRLDLTVRQRIGKGTLSLTGNTTDYWNENRRTTNFSLGYNGQIGRASYSISARRTLESSLFNSGAQRQSTGAFLTLSMPLGVAPRAPRLSASAGSDRTGNSYRLGVGGNFGEEQQGTYSASYNRNPTGSDLSANVAYLTPAAQLGVGWDKRSGGQQLGLSASGGLVLHSGGLTFSQRLGDTVGLVHVPDAQGARVGHMRGIKTNRQGYAVVPYLSAYRLNEISVDPRGLPLDIELKSGSVTAVPTSGAVVRAVIPTASGRSALIEALQGNGEPLPFGLDVVNDDGEAVGVVGQGSRLWVRGIDVAGQLHVDLGGAAGRCTIEYDLDRSADGMLLLSRCESSSIADSTVDPNAAQAARPTVREEVAAR
ncbi:fimbrial assembly protein [Stenotrophomonas maltophilia]|uniref:Fimbrial assembly protein n=1 Tax=Stenotrophomonas maltophilia TaxID=40324 RepID=A0A1A6Y078_STEMA|nr:fimbria/pilus outer membrane usher protein [Stenotrophomonas maltophilia]OBU68375.1 fimbrial assembly protein [Stenotrophomonas maltophilia]